MKNKAKSLIAILLLLAVLLIEPLHLNIVAAQTIPGTQDDTFGVWLFSAGTTVPGGAPTDDIIESAIYYNLLDYIGDSLGEVYDFDWGPSEPTPGTEDTTLPEVIEGLSAIDDFGMIADKADDPANFDTGSEGYFEGGFDLANGQRIYADGIEADGVIGPNGATNAQEAEEAIEGYEIFIFEDAELSGMIITLSNKLGLSITISLDDFQVNPPTPNNADDTMIAIDLDNMTDFDGTYIDKIRIQDDGIAQPYTGPGDTTLEIDAIATRMINCTVNFYTDPVGPTFNITYEGGIYFDGDSENFTYGTSGWAEAHGPPGYVFDHWEIVGNVALDPDAYANPVNFTITCGGDLKAIFRPVNCTVNFFTDPVGPTFNITYEGGIYFDGDSENFTYGTSGWAEAHGPEGWVFDHWEIVGNVALDPDAYANPVNFTITCGGDLKAIFRQEGTGDLGTIGYWKHVFYVWKAGKGSFKGFVESILVGYLQQINSTSPIFSENYTLTMESAYDLLWTNPGSDMRGKALRQYFACQLNWANNAVTPSQMVDTDYDDHPDMTFGAAMTIVENILRNPHSSLAELEHAKNICDSINNM